MKFTFESLPLIDAAWRTDTVLALCAAIREGDDYGSCPILADALQDAGCDNEGLLATLRAVSHARTVQPIVRALVAVVYREDANNAAAEIASAADWLGSSRSLSYHSFTPDHLFVAALDYVDNDQTFHEGTGTTFSDRFAEFGTHRFWNAFEILTGRTGVENDCFFRCSC